MYIESEYPKEGKSSCKFEFNTIRVLGVDFKSNYCAIFVFVDCFPLTTFEKFTLIQGSLFHSLLCMRQWFGIKSLKQIRWLIACNSIQIEATWKKFKKELSPNVQMNPCLKSINRNVCRTDFYWNPQNLHGFETNCPAAVENKKKQSLENFGDTNRQFNLSTRIATSSKPKMGKNTHTNNCFWSPLFDNLLFLNSIHRLWKTWTL